MSTLVTDAVDAPDEPLSVAGVSPAPPAPDAENLYTPPFVRRGDVWIDERTFTAMQACPRCGLTYQPFYSPTQTTTSDYDTITVACDLHFRLVLADYRAWLGISKHDCYEERAAILEYDAGYARVEAERLARQMTGGIPMDEPTTTHGLELSQRHLGELGAALAKAQAEMGGALKDSANPFFKSKYADLTSVVAACRGALTKHGLSVVQSPSATGAEVRVTTLLLHSSGEWISGEVTTTAKDSSPQSVGSAITYLRRYALQSFVGIAPEDDDGEAAQGRTLAQAPPAAAPEGYAEWMVDLGATADLGVEALKAAWTKSKASYRAHLTATNPDLWASLKARAAKVA